jgi:hypothetical protein
VNLRLGAITLLSPITHIISDKLYRQEISDVMQMVSGSGEPIRAAPGGASAIAGNKREEGMCRVCGKTEGAKKCGRCGLVAYCGKEHQASDYKRHKKACREHTTSDNL